MHGLVETAEQRSRNDSERKIVLHAQFGQLVEERTNRPVQTLRLGELRQTVSRRVEGKQQVGEAQCW